MRIYIIIWSFTPLLMFAPSYERPFTHCKMTIVHGQTENSQLWKKHQLMATIKTFNIILFEELNTKCTEYLIPGWIFSSSSLNDDCILPGIDFELVRCLCLLIIVNYIVQHCNEKISGFPFIRTVLIWKQNTRIPVKRLFAESIFQKNA